VSRYQKCKTILDFTEARDSEWQWHQLGRMQICTSVQTDNHASATLLSFLQAGWLSNQQRQSTEGNVKMECENIGRENAGHDLGREMHLYDSRICNVLSVESN